MPPQHRWLPVDVFFDILLLRDLRTDFIVLPSHILLQSYPWSKMIVTAVYNTLRISYESNMLHNWMCSRSVVQNSQNSSDTGMVHDKERAIQEHAMELMKEKALVRNCIHTNRELPQHSNHAP